MIEGKTVTSVILVAGNSTRFGQNRNKNFESLNGKTVVSYSLQAFNENAYVDDIIIGAKDAERGILEKILEKTQLNKPIKIVTGGKSRQETVYHCIQETDSDIVIIHDGARPAIKQKYISQCIESMKQFKGATVGVRSKDTIKVTNDKNIVICSTKRSNTWVIQTPQCFNRKTLLSLHEKYQEEKVTDDCMLLEMNQDKVKIIEGDYTNLKITTYEDISLLKEFIKNSLPNE